MKLLFLSAVLFGTVAVAQNATSLEETKIKKVILAETMAYEQESMDAWEDTVTKSTNMTFVYGLADGTRGHINGYDNIKTLVQEWMDGEEDTYEFIERSNWNIKINGNQAWATFREKATVNGQTTIGEEIRILEKIDGKWKLDVIAFIF
ncbi:MAG: hypothetical protein AAFU57_03575 [Bacteroidota bacterium]